MCIGVLCRQSPRAVVPSTHLGGTEGSLNHSRPPRMHVGHFLGTRGQIAPFTMGKRGSSGLIPGVAEAGHHHPAHSSCSAAALIYASQTPAFINVDRRPQPRGVPRRCVSRRIPPHRRDVPSSPKASVSIQPRPLQGRDPIRGKCRGRLTSNRPKTTGSLHIREAEEMWSRNYFL